MLKKEPSISWKLNNYSNQNIDSPGPANTCTDSSSLFDHSSVPSSICSFFCSFLPWFCGFFCSFCVFVFVFVHLFVCLFLFVWDMLSLFSPGHSGTPPIDHADLELKISSYVCLLSTGKCVPTPDSTLFLSICHSRCLPQPPTLVLNPDRLIIMIGIQPLLHGIFRSVCPFY